MSCQWHHYKFQYRTIKNVNEMQFGLQDAGPGISLTPKAPGFVHFVDFLWAPESLEAALIALWASEEVVLDFWTVASSFQFHWSPRWFHDGLCVLMWLTASVDWNLLMIVCNFATLKSTLSVWVVWPFLPVSGEMVLEQRQSCFLQPRCF